MHRCQALSSVFFLVTLMVACGNARADTCQEIPVTTSIGDSAHPEWSPDGQWITFRKKVGANRQIYKIRANGSDDTALTFDNNDHEWPVWSPDGQWIAYSKYDGTGTWQSYKIAAGGGSEIPMSTQPGYRERPRWSPDSQWLCHWNRDTSGVRQIYKISVNGGQEIALTSSTAYDRWYPEWSPDGQWIVFDGGGQIRKVSSEGGPDVDLNGFGNTVDCSPDGQWVCYEKVLGAYTHVYKVPLVGGTEVALTSGTFQRPKPRWSPDGTRILYHQYNGAWQIFTVQSSGGSEVPLTGPTQDRLGWPQWSPDGTWVAYYRMDGTGYEQIYKVATMESGCGITQTAVPTQSPTATATATPTPSATPTEDPTATSSPTMTATEEPTATHTPTAAPTSTSTEEPTATFTPTVTPTYTSTTEPTATSTQTGTSTGTASPTPSATPTEASTVTANPTESPTATCTAAPSATPTAVGGWTSVVATKPLSGLVLYGDKTASAKDMAGLPASVTLSTEHHLAHFSSTSRWYTGVTVANPNDIEAKVSITAYRDDGNALGSANVVVPGKGKMSKLVSNLFTPSVTGTGWIHISSDEAVLAFDLYGDKISGGIAAMPGSPLGTSILLPHFVNSNRWWTGFAVLNPGSTSAQVTMTAYNGDGTSLDQQTCSLAPMSKRMGMVESMLPGASNQTGWVLVESPGVKVAGLVVYGDRQLTPNRIAALTAMPSSTRLNLSDFRSDTHWWTGIALVNPNTASTASVSLNAYSPSGSLIDGLALTVDPLHKTMGLASALFDLGASGEGWVEGTSNVPIVGLEVLNADDASRNAWGLAGIESQSSASTLCLPHQVVTSRWWTLFALANGDDSNPAQAMLMSFEDDGSSMATSTPIIPANGRIADLAEALLGL